MNYAKISQVAHYVPSNCVTNDDLTQLMDTSDEWISSRTGIRQRYLSQSENTSDLASQVAKQLLSKAKLDPLEIDFILVATMTPDSSTPATATLVQHQIGASRAFAFDLTAACSGFVFALATAEKYIRSGLYRKGLVIGAETMSKVVDWQDRSTAVLFGDGAGGVLLETGTEPSFIAESLYSDGGRSSCLVANQMNLATPFSEQEESFPYLSMNGRSVFEFAVKDVSKSIQSLLEEHGIDKESIDYYLLHQANIRILDKMAKKIGLDREKFPANMMSYGNTSAASIPILLSECVENGKIKRDGSQTILLSGFGGGLTWGNLIVTI